MATRPVTRTGGDQDSDKQPGEARLDAIVRSVLDALGRPDDFLRATIRPVREDTFRVNVMTGPDASSVRIAHSYFLTADAKGNVTGSTPPIRKCY